MPTIMQRLREETAEHHKRAEARPLEQALVRGGVSRDAFIEYLSQRYLIHKALDAAVMGLVARDARLRGLVSAELLQEPNLRADLEWFGAAVDVIAPRRSTSRLIADMRDWAACDPIALLGAYYVFEGSKNGARYICKGLMRGLGLTPGSGTRYLDPHGEAQRELWMAFKARMDAIAFTPAECDAMVRAAAQTFDRIGELDDECAELLGVAAA